MSAARSPLSYNRKMWHNLRGVPLPHQKTKINPGQFKAFLLNEGEIFLEGVPKGQWVPVAMIPQNIRTEVIELLDQGTVMFRENSKYKQMQVIDNEDFTSFKLVPGMGTLRKEGYGI